MAVGARTRSREPGSREVELSEREVEVYRFDELERRGDIRRFVIECSSGTYVRTLISELGDAYCERLRRLRIGCFEVADADPEHVGPLNDALGFIAEVPLGPDDARRASHGAAIDREPPRGWSG